MVNGNSRGVSSNQTGPHDNIPALVRRHLSAPSQKPFSQHTLDAFAEVQQWLGNWQGELILDSCCGVGESTSVLAARYPDARVIGVDKSAHRLARHQLHHANDCQNYRVVQADLNDFWRLAHQAGWQLSQHYLLYPNPYPKSSHVQRRWHASPAFATILQLGGLLTVRSNWQIYVAEFALALQTAGVPCQHQPYASEQPMTAFERKYWASGQSSWQLSCDLTSAK